MASRAVSFAATVIACALATTPSAGAQAPAAAARTTDGPLPPDASGEDIYRAACATCHGDDGAGAPRAVVGFAQELPDFTDCSLNTVEPFADWNAVVHRGGPIRALDRHMPAFGDAMDDDQIARAIKHIWTFCNDTSWPRGDLNLPRAFFTEKAFPENETVWTTGITMAGTKAVGNALIYEHRLGSRAQYEVTVPLNLLQAEPGRWRRGLGDIEFAMRATFLASVERGTIAAAGAAITLPTGKETAGLGNGFIVYEPFAMIGQAIGASGFVQVHGGIEIPSNHSRAVNEGFLRTAVGASVAGDGGFGRSWTPMMEVLIAKTASAPTEWDVVPQMQVSLSKLQHVLISLGVRVPLNERQERKPQLLTYLLWDWFDGGLFEFWK